MARKRFPGWWYGPNGEAKQFDCIEDVPLGWADSHNAFDDKGKPVKDANIKKATKAPKATKPKNADDNQPTDEELVAILTKEGYDTSDATREQMLETLQEITNK